LDFFQYASIENNSLGSHFLLTLIFITSIIETLENDSCLIFDELSFFGPTIQSHYIEVAQGDIFMEQKMRFGLVLGQLAILKKMGGRL
jgi:hypothetical protein